jgi:hypothetical protein
MQTELAQSHLLRIETVLQSLLFIDLYSPFNHVQYLSFQHLSRLFDIRFPLATMSAILISFLISLIISLVIASPITDHTPAITDVLPLGVTEIRERDSNYYVQIASHNAESGTMGSTFEACFQVKDGYECIVTAFIDTATQFWQMYMFDHNCVLIGYNPSVYYADLLGGWGFDSRLAKVTVLYIDYPPSLDRTSPFIQNTVLKYNRGTYHPFKDGGVGAFDKLLE